jgi:hypothetical protein
LKHVGAKIQDKKVQIVIACDFNDKKRVHFVGTIIFFLKKVLQNEKSAF